MDQKKNARHRGRAKESNTRKDRPRDAARQAQRLPRPDAIKAAIDPAEFYARRSKTPPP